MTYQHITLYETGENNPNMIKKIEDDGTIRFVPNDPDNKDWQEYQLWLSEDNEPEEAD